MTRWKDSALVCLAGATAVLAFLVWRQEGELRRLRAAAAPANVAGPAVTLRRGTAQTLVLAPALPAPMRMRDGQERDSAAEAIGYGLAPAVNAPRRARGIARLLDNPDFVQALRLHQNGVVDARFAELFRRLNLTAGELANFKRLLMEKETVALDVVAVGQGGPEAPLSPAALQASVHAAQAQVDSAILASLGNERYAIYRDYEQTLAQRATVAQLEQRLSYTNAPLTSGQAESLVRILVANAPRDHADLVPAVSLVIGADAADVMPVVQTHTAAGRVTNEAIAQAQTVLSPEQQSALRDIHAEQQAALRAAQLIREALPAGKAFDLPGVGLVPLLQ